MKYLIIPDVHDRWELAEKTINHNKDCDKVIFLGDYFDDFDDDPHIIADVADWFHHSVNNPNRIHLVGNHELHYWFVNNEHVRCSGYSQPKSFVINDFVKPEDWRKLVFFHVLDGKWLLTHGGLHPAWIKPQEFSAEKASSIRATIEDARKLLEVQAEEFYVRTHRNQLHWFDIPGYSRCRNSPFYGGILWCDWTNEFWPTRGLHQIVGHSPLRAGELPWKFLKKGDPITHSAALGVVPKLSDETSYNLCLDTHPGSQLYAIYDNGVLTIHRNEFVTVHETRRHDDEIPKS